MSRIKDLKTVKPVIINKKYKNIIELYKRFYGENPDFTSEYIELKITTMIHVLMEVGILPKDYYAFEFNTAYNVPLSDSVHNLVKDLFAYEIIDSYGSPARISQRVLNLTDRIGRVINTSLPYGIEYYDYLSNLASTIFASDFNLAKQECFKVIESKTSVYDVQIQNCYDVMKKVRNIVNE